MNKTGPSEDISNDLLARRKAREDCIIKQGTEQTTNIVRRVCETLEKGLKSQANTLKCALTNDIESVRAKINALTSELNSKLSQVFANEAKTFPEKTSQNTKELHLWREEFEQVMMELRQALRNHALEVTVTTNALMEMRMEARLEHRHVLSNVRTVSHRQGVILVLEILLLVIFVFGLWHPLRETPQNLNQYAKITVNGTNYFWVGQVSTTDNGETMLLVVPQTPDK